MPDINTSVDLELEEYPPSHLSNDFASHQVQPPLRYSWSLMPHQKLYICHALTQWDDRMWQFAVPIIFSSLFPETLFPSIMFSFSGSLSCFLFAPYVGLWIDRSERKNSILGCLIVLHAAMALDAVFIGMILYSFTHQLTDWTFIILYSLTCLVAGISELANTGRMIAVEKDWAVVITRAEDFPVAQTNAALKRIDLTCNVTAPILFGFLVALTNLKISLAVVAGCNVISFFPEIALLRIIHQEVPSLDEKSVQNDTTGNINPFKALMNGWRDYFKHKVTCSSLAYVLLYITVLSGGVSMFSYLNSIGIKPLWIAVFSAAASIMGIGSTWIVVPVLDRCGNIRSGQIFLSLQLIFLTVSIVSFFVISEESSSMRILLFLSGIVVSRAGLWGFDMVEIQQVQLLVESEIRGVFNSTESALTNLAYLIILGLGLILHRPEDFKWLVIISFSCVVIANCLYLIWWRSVLGGQNQIDDDLTIPFQPLSFDETNEIDD